MSDIYEILKPSKGFAYRDDQIVSQSLVKTPIPSEKILRGRSRVYGDVDDITYKKIVDIIISLSSRYELTYKETAYTLLICLAESGFNPDASAGTTSASGLAQYTKDTANAFKARSKDILGIEIDMTGMNVFDATIGSYGVLVSFLFNRNLAIKWGFNVSDAKYWQLIYMLHHDGPGYYTDDRGKERALKFNWRKDAINTYNRIFNSKLTLLENLLKKNVETKIKLTDKNGENVENKNYLIATVEKSSTQSPSHLSMNRSNSEKGVKAILGKTDSNGESVPIISKIGDEIVAILLPDDYKKKLSISPNESYIVKKGDSLSKIAKNNNTTVSEIAKNNNIKDVNSIKEGQKLILNSAEQYVVKKGDSLSKIAKKYETTIDEIIRNNNIKNPNNISVGQKIKINKYLRRTPSNSALNEIFCSIGLNNINLEIVSFARNFTAKPSGSISSNTKEKENIIELRTPVSKVAVQNNEQVKPKNEENKTQSSGNTKTVKANITDGMAVIYTFQDMDYGPYEEPKKGYTVFYDHLGNKLFSFKTGSRVDSSSKKDADGPFSGYYVSTAGGTRSSRLGKAYGTTKIITNDTRLRWVHGGGGYTKKSEAPAYYENQPWRVTKGCTRAQNIDLENFAKCIAEFQKKYPNVKIKYIRDKKGTYLK